MSHLLEVSKSLGLYQWGLLKRSQGVCLSKGHLLATSPGLWLNQRAPILSITEKSWQQNRTVRKRVHIRKAESCSNWHITHRSHRKDSHTITLMEFIIHGLWWILRHSLCVQASFWHDGYPPPPSWPSDLCWPRKHKNDTVCVRMRPCNTAFLPLNS